LRTSRICPSSGFNSRGSHAERHHGAEILHQDPATGARESSFCQAAISQRDPGGRNQPDAAEDAGAMLEAMQAQGDHRGVDHVPDPFFVLATQNPSSRRHLSAAEAQLDRFMFMIAVDYHRRRGNRDHESGAGEGGNAPRKIIDTSTSVFARRCAPHARGRSRLPLRAKNRRGDRAKSPQALDFCRKWLAWGAGPRASLNLILAAKRTHHRGQIYVACEDVAAVARRSCDTADHEFRRAQRWGDERRPGADDAREFRRQVSCEGHQHSAITRLALFHLRRISRTVILLQSFVCRETMINPPICR
jgi:hypothetical protein